MIHQAADQTSTSVIEETRYGGSASEHRGSMVMTDSGQLVSGADSQSSNNVSIEVNRAHGVTPLSIAPPPPSLTSLGSEAGDQTPGQSGITEGSEDKVWRCLMIGCNTSNGHRSPICGSCDYPRPPAHMVSRAKIHQQVTLDRLAAAEKKVAELKVEKKALMTALSALSCNNPASLKCVSCCTADVALHPTQLIPDAGTMGVSAISPASSPVSVTMPHLLSQVTRDLFDMACHGNITALAQLHGMGGLPSLTNINKRFAFSPPGFSAVLSMTALAIASWQGHAAVVELLLQVPDVDVNIKDENGSTALIAAASSAAGVGIVEVILKNSKTEVNSKDQAGRTAIMRASSCGYTAVVQALAADSRVLLSITDKQGHSALTLAANNVIKEMLHFNRAANLAASVDLFAVACNGNSTTLLELQEIGGLGLLTNINELYSFKPTDWGISTMMSALAIACHQGHAAVVKLLLQIPGVDTNTQDTKYGCTALSFATRYNKVAVVRALLADARVLMNKPEKNGRTALIWACCMGFTATVQVLLADAKVDVTVVPQDGKTALAVASTEEIRDMLRAGGAMV